MNAINRTDSLEKDASPWQGAGSDEEEPIQPATAWLTPPREITPETSSLLASPGDGRVSSFLPRGVLPSIMSGTAADYGVAPSSRPVGDSFRVAPDFPYHLTQALGVLAEELTKRIRSWDELRGVRHYLSLYRFTSVEEPGLELVRLELHVPGIPRRNQFELWQRLGQLVEEVRPNVSTVLGSGQAGRALRKVRDSISTAIVPW